VTTAIVSDLHLGLTSRRDLLRRAPVFDALAAALAEADELVLLGDLLELRERPVAHVLADARPVLRQIGEAVAGRRITIVPGNHDHHLTAPLLESLRMQDGSGRLDLETVADPPAGGPLGAVADALGRERVRIAYPGVWVRDDVYATHGHYLDVHNTVPTFERIAIGAVQRVMGGLPGGRLAPDDYEAALGPVYALTYAMAQSARAGRSVAGSEASVRMWRLVNGDGGRRLPALLLGGVALPAAVAGLNRAGIGPLKPDLSAIELRRAGLRGMAAVVDRLGIAAEHVIFGHTHRSGPHDGDEGWDLPGGGRLMNTGSWIHEPAFLGSSPRESPYWPGHCALVPEAGPPELLDLLDELPAP
jgi:predicted phosphodiesterase